MIQPPPTTTTSRTVVTRVKHHVTLDNGFDLYVYTGSDGATVAEVESHGSDDAPHTHTTRNEPIARVYVNEGLQYDRSPDTPLPGIR